MRPVRLLQFLAVATLFLGCAKGKDPPAETRKISVQAGTFTMGTSNLDPCGDSRINVGGTYALGCDAKEQAAAVPHTVTVEAFCMDEREVTNLQYRHCVENDACGKPESTNIGGQNQPGFIKKYYNDPDKYGDYPVVGVSWSNARKYCAFHGGTLPTEAQWEYAASSRGMVGGDQPVWNDPAISDAIAASDCGDQNNLVTLAPCTDSQVRPAGSAPADKTADGILDLGASVQEWVLDDFDYLGYCDQDGITDNFRIADGGGRPFFAPTQSEPPASLVTDADCLDDGMGSGYVNGCNPAFIECRGVCSRAFRGNDSGEEKRALWVKEDCRVRHLVGTTESFRLEPDDQCQTDCEARGQDATACGDYCGCLTRDVDTTFNDTACLQSCMSDYQRCADDCTVDDTQSLCMELVTNGNDPVLPRPVCVARTDQSGETVHTRPEAFDVGAIAGSHAVRGGSFIESQACAATISRRDFEVASRPLLGFRCVFPANACR